MTAAAPMRAVSGWYVEILAVRDGLEVAEHAIGPYPNRAQAERGERDALINLDRARYHARVVYLAVYLAAALVKDPRP